MITDDLLLEDESDLEDDRSCVVSEEDGEEDGGYIACDSPKLQKEKEQRVANF